jgi:phosphoglycolate phosphatase-like HAD superfamily hydrolase
MDAVLFDWDGTLLDPLPSLEGATPGPRGSGR